jgi:hypothetical protein
MVGCSYQSFPWKITPRYRRFNLEEVKCPGRDVRA